MSTERMLDCDCGTELPLQIWEVKDKENFGSLYPETEDRGWFNTYLELRCPACKAVTVQ